VSETALRVTVRPPDQPNDRLLIFCGAATGTYLVGCRRCDAAVARGAAPVPPESTYAIMTVEGHYAGHAMVQATGPSHRTVVLRSLALQATPAGVVDPVQAVALVEKMITRRAFLAVDAPSEARQYFAGRGWEARGRPGRYVKPVN
jgi:hypothetical protein